MRDEGSGVLTNLGSPRKRTIKVVPKKKKRGRLPPYKKPVAIAEEEKSLTGQEKG